MPNPDPSDIPRPLFGRRPEFPSAPVEPPAESAPAFRPQYVSLHSLREYGHGPRNLAWGVVTLLLAVLLTSVAIFLTGSKALISLAVCLLTFTALFVLARMHVFRQRNGGFLALGIVCLFGAAMPLVELAFSTLDTFLKNRPLVVTTAAANPIASAAPEPHPLLTLTDAFALSPPDPGAGARVRVVKDARVSVEGKSYLVKTGDVFAYASRTARDVTIAARDLLVTLPGDAVEVLEEKVTAPLKTAAIPEPLPKVPETAPTNETSAQGTDRALRETVQRYPALGIKGSLENQMFVNSVTEFRENGGDDFFQNPEWPLELAELLAKRHHWQRGAPPATVGPITDPVEEPSVPQLR